MAAGSTANQPPADRGPNTHKPVRIDWPKWLVGIERKRRMLIRLGRQRPTPAYLFGYIAQATLSSFRLDKLEVTEVQVADALSRGSARKVVRSRLAQRIRNHAAIVLYIESLLRCAKSLTARMVVRWYTSISSGLSTAALDDNTIDRLESLVRRINSPQLRLQAAITEAARIHTQLLAEPFVPGFNGILARLILQYHIGRSGLPGIVFESPGENGSPPNENTILSAVLHGVDRSYDRMIEIPA